MYFLSLGQGFSPRMCYFLYTLLLISTFTKHRPKNVSVRSDMQWAECRSWLFSSTIYMVTLILCRSNMIFERQTPFNWPSRIPNPVQFQVFRITWLKSWGVEGVSWVVIVLWAFEHNTCEVCSLSSTPAIKFWLLVVRNIPASMGWLDFVSKRPAM